MAENRTINAANPTVEFRLGKGSVELAGNFDGGTVTAKLLGGSVAVQIFTVDSTAFTQADQMEFTMAGGGGSESVKITWYPDR